MMTVDSHANALENVIPAGAPSTPLPTMAPLNPPVVPPKLPEAPITPPAIPEGTGLPPAIDPNNPQSFQPGVPGMSGPLDQLRGLFQGFKAPGVGYYPPVVGIQNANKMMGSLVPQGANRQPTTRDPFRRAGAGSF